MSGTQKFSFNLIKDPQKPNLYATGHYLVDGITFKFSVNKTTYNDYAYRLHIAAISPRDGHVMQYQGDERTKHLVLLSEKERARYSAGKRVKKLNIVFEPYVPKGKDVRKAIKQYIEQIRGEYDTQFNRELDRAITSEITAPRAFRAKGRSYLNSISTRVNTQTKKTKKYRLSKICNLLSAKPMKDLTINDIKAAFTELDVNDKTLKSYLNLLIGFWDYCNNTGFLNCTNEAERYRYVYHYNKREQKKKIPPRASLTRLTREQELALDEYISNHIGDGRCMAIVLLNGAGIKGQLARDLRWKDIVFSHRDPGDVTVRLYAPDKLHATHDYSRPVFREEGKLLLKRYQYLQLKYGKDLNKFPVISEKYSPFKSPMQKEITGHIRYVMINIEGIGCNGLNSLPDISQPNGRPEGKAVLLLAANYKAKLMDCGVVNDTAMLDFLLCRDIQSVTGDSYRGLTSPEASRQIRCILDRFCLHDEVSSQQPKPERKTENDIKFVSIPSPSPRRYNKYEGTVRLKAGQFLELRADKGLNAELNAFINSDAPLNSVVREITLY